MIEIFKEQTNNKKWSLKLDTDVDKNVILAAVDFYNGNIIAILITFNNDGAASNSDALFELKENGYDPFEHGNWEWNKRMGNIIIAGE